ncbi:hypothetical protein PB2503_08054 [Parvularcula bermudensis HTCC2503]|uniref:Uncharacterized protein n=1 Tax=Parvularcula bermudensis (strain ATCC BAA-594 / HTCC2503 / KCTC 12087) TaxID=314260 RepID=E0TH82_PARBH|nr:YcgN family cysteine cluster protein [Parvularcula bermudensis]ADM09666.1 hypothetical protein PB2503_08054 [Parvularcula bermudensis HTCC2503]
MAETGPKWGKPLPPRQDRPFWETKSLGQMSAAEWESLCDGCGRCCLVLLEDEEEEGRYHETSLCCQLFDPQTRRCTRYAERRLIVPDCVKVSPDNAGTLSWMPESCAYRRLAGGRGLAPWHPLRSGRRESVVEAGVAVDGQLTNEREVSLDELWRYVTGEERS